MEKGRKQPALEASLGSGKGITQVFWSRLRQGRRTGSPRYHCALLETKKETGEGGGGRDGSHLHHPRPQAFLPSPDLSLSAQALRDYGG